MAEIFERGNSDPTKSDSTESLRYRLLMQNVTEVMLEIHSQALVTEFSPETWETQGKTLVVRVLNNPGRQWFWKNFRDNYPENFRAQVADILATEATSKSDD